MNEDELREFMGEIREFKRQILARLSSIESKHQSDGARRLSIAALCVSGFNCAMQFFANILKRG